MPTLTATHFNQMDFQLQNRNHFEVVFDNKNNMGWDSNMTLLVKSFPLPRESTEVNTIDHFNQQIKLAGKTTFEGGELVIHDAISYDTEKMFRQWRKQVYDAKKGIMGYAANYKQNGTITEYSPNGEKYREWTLIGCWPSNVNYGDLDYEAGGVKDITATIVYDWAYRSEGREDL